MLMFILLLSSTEIHSGIKLAHLVVRRMFQSIVLCVWVVFRLIGQCVLTVWASFELEEPASIGDRRLFESRRFIEVLRYA